MQHVDRLRSGTSMWIGGSRSVLAGPAVIAASVATAPAPAIDVPEGFEVVPVVSGLEGPVGVAFAGDGRLFIAEQRGVVRVFAEGKLLPDPFIDLRDEVNGQRDRGLLGIAAYFVTA